MLLRALAIFGLCLAASGAQADDDYAFVQTRFKDFCLGRTAAQSEVALLKSPLFEAPSLLETSFSRLAIFKVEGNRAGVSVYNDSASGFQCDASIHNAVTLVLYEGGRTAEMS